MKRIIFFSFFFLLFFSCKKNEKTTETQTILITDYHNRQVKIKKNIKKIVSLSPGITELLFDLESGERLIGRTDYCNYPQEVNKIASIGGISNVNVERIIALRPDIVISSSMIPKDKLLQIEHSDIDIVALPERNTIEGMYQTIKILGKILEKDSLAAQIINEMQQKMAIIQAKNHQNTDKNTRPKVYYVIGFGSGDFSAGKDTYINDIITLAGGQNIAENARNWTFSKEELFAKEPDFIFIRAEDYSQFIKTKPYTNLSAVKNRRVFPIESTLMDCQTTRSLQVIDYISNIIHSK